MSVKLLRSLMKTPDVGGADTGVRCKGSALAECGLAYVPVCQIQRQVYCIIWGRIRWRAPGNHCARPAGLAKLLNGCAPNDASGSDYHDMARRWLCTKVPSCARGRRRYMS